MRRSSLTVFTICLAVFAAPTPQLPADDDVKPEVSADKSDDGVAALRFSRDRDPELHRLFESLHASHMLAEAGAGYEAARVLAALALRAGDTDPGREARQVLESWGLTVDSVRQGTAADINRRIEKAKRDDRRGRMQNVHVHNLIELRRYAMAARVLRESAGPDRGGRGAIEVLERYRIPIENLGDDAEGAERKLAGALQRGHQRNLRRRDARLVQVFDHEAAELARMLIRKMEPERDRRRPEHENQFARWMERRERERGHEPTVAQIVRRAVERAGELVEEKPEAARMLAAFVASQAADSPDAERARQLARELTEQASQPQPNTMRRQTIDQNSTEDDVFASKRVRNYQLELSDDALALLREEPKEYVRATFREGDRVYPDIGVRLKGSWGSFRMFDGEAKAAFTVKFNEFVKGQRFHGLRRIVLNNGVQDPSYLHECIGYGLFRDAGVPAPRVAYANVSVNGRSFGLYIQIEAITRDFLQRWYAKTNGNLYEGPGDVVDWRGLELDSNQERDNRHDLRLLAMAVERADDENPWIEIDRRVNADELTRFLALEHLLGHWDGYVATNNFRMYGDPTTNKFEFIPHGADQIFQEPAASVYRSQGGILARALTQTDEGRARYNAVMRRVLSEVWREETIRSRIAETYLLIRPHVVAGASKGPSLEEFEHHVNSMLDFVSIRRYAVLSQLRGAERPDSWREPRRHEEMPSLFRRSRREWR
ncbi:MAG: CotH kinase family protein [Pirellulaceae bacterium]|jgi:spore coat protein CotH|nr:CotH kinase family protein [Pirellulaceae bacterium]MDP7018698.1 CotH kinase family protein [Pirellulaceae bacterium]